MLGYDNLCEVAKYATRIPLLRLLSTCKTYRMYTSIYYEKFTFKFNQTEKKIAKQMWLLKHDIISKCTKLFYNFKSNNHMSIIQFSRTITWLQLGDKFDDDIINLPANIKVLKIGNMFNHALINDKFNYDSTGIRPILTLKYQIQNPLSYFGLTTLEFGRKFNQIVDGLLPITLKKLVLGNAFNQTIDNLPVN